MKKGLKIVIGVVVCLYLIVVVFTTGFLLNRNDYGVSSFLGRDLLIVEDNNLEPDYKEHSFLIIKKVDNEKIEVGTKAFFYDTYSNEHKIKYAEVTKKDKINEEETTFTMKDNSVVSSQYVLGTENSVTSLNSLGQFLYVVQSRWGFLFIVVFPLFLAFMYEIYAIYKEVKNK
ncbi:MAG: hypothetical protein IJ568_03700 [Bacilli bacterium]|nr:hypothetical protein [Bacilli bacterium]